MPITYHSQVVNSDNLDLDQAEVADSLAFLCLKQNNQLIHLALMSHIYLLHVFFCIKTIHR